MFGDKPAFTNEQMQILSDVVNTTIAQCLQHRALSEAEITAIVERLAGYKLQEAQLRHAAIDLAIKAGGVQPSPAHLLNLAQHFRDFMFESATPSLDGANSPR